MKLHELEINDAELRDYCVSHGIRELLLFGSVTRSDFSPESDVDVIVRFEMGRKPDLWNFAGMQSELSRLFGRPVHLHTEEMIEERLRMVILRDAKVAYAA